MPKSQESYFAVPVSQMRPFITYVVPGTRQLVKKDEVPKDIKIVRLAYDLPVGHLPAATQDEALLMCDVG